MSADFPIKINAPQFIFTIPSTKEKATFRPFLVGEQKSLLLALATEDTETIVHAIKNIIDACSGGKVKSNQLASFDIEYLFLMLRARSIGENVPLTTQCSHCESDVKFKIDVSQAEVDFTDTIEPKIQLTDDVGVKMKYPPLADVINMHSQKTVTEEMLMDIITKCIDGVWNSEDYVSASDYPQETMQRFVDTLTVAQASKLTQFVLLMPAVRMRKNISCPHCKKQFDVLVEGLENFFG